MRTLLATLQDSEWELMELDRWPNMSAPYNGTCKDTGNKNNSEQNKVRFNICCALEQCKIKDSRRPRAVPKIMDSFTK